MCVVIFLKKICGFALFFLATGMILGFFVSGFIEFLIIVILLLMSYILFCK